MESEFSLLTLIKYGVAIERFLFNGCEKPRQWEIPSDDIPPSAEDQSGTNSYGRECLMLIASGDGNPP